MTKTVEPAHSHAPAANQRSLRRRAAIMLSRFRRDRKGATAIEFGLLSFPFFFMLMMIVETSIVFWTRQVLQEATQQASRTILTGESRTLYGGSPAAQTQAFRDTVCGLMRTTTAADCANRLFIDVQPLASFPGTVDSMVQGSAIDPSGFSMRQPGPSQIVLVRTVYTLPVFTTGFFGEMSRLTNGNNALEATVAFRTEPFPIP
jgi:Flp pilus assembly protein TadG